MLALRGVVAMVDCSSGSVTVPVAGTETGQGAVTLDAVHDLLRDRILGGELAPGSVVSQAHLARDLGVSRSPIREACRMLEREGLVVSRHNHRIQVADFSIGDLEQLYAARLVLEPLALTVRVPRLPVADVVSVVGGLPDAGDAADAPGLVRMTVAPDRPQAAARPAGAPGQV